MSHLASSLFLKVVDVSLNLKWLTRAARYRKPGQCHSMKNSINIINKKYFNNNDRASQLNVKHHVFQKRNTASQNQDAEAPLAFPGAHFGDQQCV